MSCGRALLAGLICSILTSGDCYGQPPRPGSYSEEEIPVRRSDRFISEWSDGDAVLVTSTWINSTGGSWGDSSNWSAGIPGSGDDVVFSSTSAAKTITLGQNRSVRSVTFNSTQTGAVTLSGFVLTLSPSTSGDTTLLVDSASGDHIISSSIQLAGQNNQVFDIGSGRVLTISGNIAGSTTSRSFTKAGAGTLLLTGNANTYSGGTTISAGTVQLSGSGTLGSTTGTLTVNGGTLNLDGTSQTVGALNGSGGSVRNTNSSSASTLTVGNGNATGSYAGSIDLQTGTVLNLTKTGNGTQTLTGNNSFNGATTVNGGTLALANTGGLALSGTSGLTVNSGGTLLMGANNQIHVAAPPPITLAGGAINSGGFNQGGAGAAGQVGLGALTLTANSTINLAGTSVLHFANSSANAWSGTLSVLNWTGTLLSGGGAEQLLFGSSAGTGGITLAQLGMIQFVDPAGLAPGTYAAMFASGDFAEIIPNGLAPVPEPGTWAAGVLAFVAVGWTQRRRLRRIFKKRTAATV